MRRMQDSEREETWDRWSRGEGAGGIGLRDALHSNKIMIFISLLSLLYFFIVKIGGEQYNVSLLDGMFLSFKSMILIS